MLVIIIIKPFVHHLAKYYVIYILTQHVAFPSKPRDFHNYYSLTVLTVVGPMLYQYSFSFLWGGGGGGTYILFVE
jgi:hypothetical protein